MATPWRSALDRLEVDSQNLRVIDYDPDWVRSNHYNNNAQAPIARRDTPYTGAMWTEPSFAIQDAGSGAAGTAPVHDALFEACGLVGVNIPASSEAYTWSEDLIAVAQAVDLYIGNGLKQQAANAIFNLVLEYRTDAPIIHRYNGWGTFVTPTEAAGSAALGTSAKPIVCKDMTGTLASDVLHIREIDILLNNVSNSPNVKVVGSSSDGCDSPDLTDSIPTARVLLEIPAFSTHNYWTDLLANNALALNIVGTGSAGNINTTDLTIYQNAKPNIQNINGVYFMELVGDMGHGSGEPLTIVYT